MRLSYLLFLWVVSAATLSLQASLGAEQGMLPVSILLMIPLVVMACEDVQSRRDRRRVIARVARFAG